MAALIGLSSTMTILNDESATIQYLHSGKTTLACARAGLKALYL
jgi:hypothetical protein